MPFIDRNEAGRLLGERLAEVPLVDPVVLALPRGGVPVGYQVALAIDAPLDVIVVRKLGVPFQPELAMGAIGEDSVRVLDDDVVAAGGISAEEIRTIEARERTELERRSRRYRSGNTRIALPGRTAVIVDDGMATGSTARAACLVARAHGAAQVVMAVPVASRQAVTQLRRVADEVIALEMPEPFFAVGQWYLRFDQTSDEDVVALLGKMARRRSPVYAYAPPTVAASPLQSPADPPDNDDDPPDPVVVGKDVEVEVGTVRLSGSLAVPEGAHGLVLFAHGSGSGRHSPRNRYVADVLNHAGLATLLFDLLTPEEERQRANVFDVPLLGARLQGATEWVVTRPEAGALPIGYFGASTGSAAALWAAACGGIPIGAVVSRGGRPDLAGANLAAVTAPTLLIVGGRDEQVLELNRLAQSVLTCENRLVVVPGATHLFTEPGTLQEVADLAERWFTEHLPVSAAARSAGRPPPPGPY